MTSRHMGARLPGWYGRSLLLFLALTVLGQLVTAVTIAHGWFGTALPPDRAVPASQVYRETAMNLPAFLVVVGLPTALVLLLLIPVGRWLRPGWFRPVAVVLMLLPAPWLLILYDAFSLFVLLLVIQVVAALLIPHPPRRRSSTTSPAS